MHYAFKHLRSFSAFISSTSEAAAAAAAAFLFTKFRIHASKYLKEKVLSWISVRKGKKKMSGNCGK